MKKITQDGLPDSFSLAELARIQGSKEAPYMRSVWIHVNDNQVSIEEYDGSLNETLRRDGAERVLIGCWQGFLNHLERTLRWCGIPVLRSTAWRRCHRGK